jgi:hypothetical protein
MSGYHRNAYQTHPDDQDHYTSPPAPMAAYHPSNPTHSNPPSFHTQSYAPQYRQQEEYDPYRAHDPYEQQQQYPVEDDDEGYREARLDSYQRGSEETEYLDHGGRGVFQAYEEEEEDENVEGYERNVRYSGAPSAYRPRSGAYEEDEEKAGLNEDSFDGVEWKEKEMDADGEDGMGSPAIFAGGFGAPPEVSGSL